MSKAVELNINNKRIKVTETSCPKEVLNVLNKFVDSLSNRTTDRVIGFDSRFFGLEDHPCYISDRAIIALCDGESCLIFRYNEAMFTYLSNFLRLPHVVFVGSGIKSSMRALKKRYRLYCRNVVELGPLAAPMVQYPSSPGFAIDLNSNWRDEGCLIASTAYSYFEIGCKKLGDIEPSGMPGTLYFQTVGQMI